MIVVGAGRVGGALRERGAAAGVPVTLVDRTNGWDAVESGSEPILLAVRNDDLPEVIRRTPESRRADLVFLQNGAIRPLLAAHGADRATRGLLYFMVKARGAPLVPGRTSWLCGPHAEAVTSFFTTIGVGAEAVDWARFSYYELEKLVWLAAHGPLCTAFDATVGEVATTHRASLTELVSELWAVGSPQFGVEAPVDYVVEQLVDYSGSIPDYRASVKEWPYRNGWFHAAATEAGVTMPIHDALLQAQGHLDVP